MEEVTRVGYWANGQLYLGSYIGTCKFSKEEEIRSKIKNYLKVLLPEAHLVKCVVDREVDDKLHVSLSHDGENMIFISISKTLAIEFISGMMILS